MKKAWFLVALIAVAGCMAPTNSDTPSAKDGVVIHLTHGADDPHRVAMALQMANMMSESRDVLVYCDISGIEVCLKDAPEIQHSHFPSSGEQISKLLDAGVTIMACPGCLKAAGKTEADLAEGIQVADKDKFFSFTTGRILSLDY